MKLPRKVNVAEEVVAAELDGNVVLLDMQQELYYSLDAVGSRMWQLLNEGNAVEDVVATLLDEYDVEEQLLRADLGALIARLQSSRLMVIVD